MMKGKSIILLFLAIACVSAEGFTPTKIFHCAKAKLNGVTQLPTKL
jgi:hypothetical protein